MSNAKAERITFRMTPALAQDVRQVAADRGYRTPSEFIRNAVAKELENGQNKRESSITTHCAR